MLCSAKTGELQIKTSTGNHGPQSDATKTFEKARPKQKRIMKGRNNLEEEITDKDFRQSYWLALQFWVQPNRIFFIIIAFGLMGY